MTNIFSNKYVRFGLSCFNILYLLMIGVLSFWTFSYELRFSSEGVFFVFYIVLSVLFGVFMFVTRREFLTRLVSLTMLFVVFFLMIFNLERPLMFVPPLIIGVFMFFICSAGDTTKVIMGSLYILMFVVGLVVYNIASALFGGSAIETVLNSSVTDQKVALEYDMAKIEHLNNRSISPDGKYRYYILDVQDNDRGKVIIVVEPNNLDINYNFFTLVEAGYTSRVAKYTRRGVTPDIEWVVDPDYDPTKIYTDSEGNEIHPPKYMLRYRFGENSEWKTSRINIPSDKNYLRFLNIN